MLYNILYLTITNYVKLPCPLRIYGFFSPEDGQDWLEHVEAILINILLNCVFSYALCLSYCSK